MIAKEKIKQSARIYSTSKNRGFEGAEYIVRSIASEYDFKAGVEFAEAELSKPFTSSNTRQNLFNYFAEQHGVNLMDSDFNEIGNYMHPETKKIKIDFCGHVKAKIEINNGTLTVIAAMNGYGDALDPDQIVISELLAERSEK